MAYPALSRGPRGLFPLCGGSCRAASPAWGLPWGLCRAATSGPTTGLRSAASGLLPQGRAGPPWIGRCGWTVEPPFPSGGLSTSQPAGHRPGDSAQPLEAGHPQSRGPECQARVGGRRSHTGCSGAGSVGPARALQEARSPPGRAGRPREPGELTSSDPVKRAGSTSGPHARPRDTG